jgi:hypothetical protein
MITFQRESIRPCWDVFAERLFPLHWEEFGEDRESIPLAPDKDRYFAMEDQKTLYLLTLRDMNALFGYYIGIVRTGLHYQTTLQGSTDIFFVHPRYKDGLGTRARLLLRLLKEAEEMMKDAGVFRHYLCEKLRHPLDTILPRLGYRPVERVWSKILR